MQKIHSSSTKIYPDSETKRTSCASNLNIISRKQTPFHLIGRSEKIGEYILYILNFSCLSSFCVHALRWGMSTMLWHATQKLPRAIASFFFRLVQRYFNNFYFHHLHVLLLFCFISMHTMFLCKYHTIIAFIFGKKEKMGQFSFVLFRFFFLWWINLY